MLLFFLSLCLILYLLILLTSSSSLSFSSIVILFSLNFQLTERRNNETSEFFFVVTKILWCCNFSLHLIFVGNNFLSRWYFFFIQVVPKKTGPRFKLIQTNVVYGGLKRDNRVLEAPVFRVKSWLYVDIKISKLTYRFMVITF